MLPRHVQTLGNLLERKLVHFTTLRGIHRHFCLWYSTVLTCNEMPRKLSKFERKPPVTSFNELKREARLKKKERQKFLLPDVNYYPVFQDLSTILLFMYAAIAVQGMKAWEKMCTGASKLMEKYDVQTCGYCPEVQVGPKGHRVRNCQAFKHQMRDGQHAWQKATINDLAPPVCVYHIRDQQPTKPLVNELRMYYGMLPAVIELFAQAGAPVGKNYACMMREDVVIPEMDEEKWVV